MGPPEVRPPRFQHQVEDSTRGDQRNPNTLPLSLSVSSETPVRRPVGWKRVTLLNLLSFFFFLFCFLFFFRPSPATSLSPQGRRPWGTRGINRYGGRHRESSQADAEKDTPLPQGHLFLRTRKSTKAPPCHTCAGLLTRLCKDSLREIGETRTLTPSVLFSPPHPTLPPSLQP